LSTPSALGILYILQTTMHILTKFAVILALGVYAQCQINKLKLFNMSLLKCFQYKVSLTLIKIIILNHDIALIRVNSNHELRYSIINFHIYIKQIMHPPLETVTTKDKDRKEE